MLQRLLGHASNYALASVLVTLAGVISFPIFTRIFSVSEYGLLNLVSSMLGLMVGLGKLGLQTSTIRFFAEVEGGKSDLTEDAFISTALLGMVVAGACATIAVVLFSELVPGWFWSDPRLRGLMILTSVLVLVRVVDSCLVNVLRAQERSGVYGIYIVARRYGGLAIILLVIFNMLPGLRGFYVGTITAEALALVTLAWFVLRGRTIRLRNYSPKLMRAMLAFGLPMAAYEMSSLLLAQGDRYVIQGLLGGAALGVYSAAYNFSEYVQAALLFPFSMAMAPMLTRAWEREGSTATRHFIEHALHFYILAVGAVLFGMAAVGGEALELLASKKYVPGAVIIPWVMLGMALDGANGMLGAGLYLNKKAKTVMALVICATVVNLGLNFALVPRQGILGAALATLITYFGLTTAMARFSRRYLNIQIPWLHALKACACGLAMYAVTAQIEHHTLIVSVGLKVVGAGLTYLVLVLAFDRRSREAIASILDRFRRSAGRGEIRPTTDTADR
jgi:O-antigen/teichoic acid export membrane protein